MKEWKKKTLSLNVNISLCVCVTCRVWWTWCMWSASPTRWWRSTLCRGSRKSASTKVRRTLHLPLSSVTPLHSSVCQKTDSTLIFSPSVSVCASPPAAKVACVKSRDMHWALVAHKDQKDINLSSLRMLLVADGSNPCKVTLSLHGGSLTDGGV